MATTSIAETIWVRQGALSTPAGSPFMIRPVESRDGEAITALTFEAFEGTVDHMASDRWQRKIDAILNGTYGPFLADASFVGMTSPGQLAGVVLATNYAAYHGPVIALIAVSSMVKRQGLGSHLLSRSVSAILSEGAPRCVAKISDGNRASERLFQAAGFTPRKLPDFLSSLASATTS